MLIIYSKKNLKKFLHTKKKKEKMIKNNLIYNARKTEEFLNRYLKKQKQTHLLRAMKYGTLSGGKKLDLQL